MQRTELFTGFLQLAGDAVVAFPKKSRIYRPLALQSCEGVILLDQFRYFVLQFRHPRLGTDGSFPQLPQLGHHGLEEKLPIVLELVEEGEE